MKYCFQRCGSWNKKLLFFECWTHIHDEPARPETVRPWSSLPAYFSNLLKDTNMKPTHNKVIGLKFVVSSFHINFFISSEAISFFAKTDFRHFYIHFCISLKNHLIFSKSNYITWENVQRSNRITIGFIFKLSFIRYEIDFKVKFTYFHPTYSENRARAGLLWMIYAV